MVQEWVEETDVILVPIGSTEQHSKHLPLGTDSMSAIQTVENAAPKANVPHTPIVWTGYSPHHMRQPGNGSGTITLRSRTYQDVLNDIGRSLIYHGFNKIVYVTGHGSNQKVIDSVLRNIRYETGALPCLYLALAESDLSLIGDEMDTSEEETPGWHSAELETSEVLSYDEELVDWDAAEKNLAQAPDQLPDTFEKKTGAPGLTFKGWSGFWFPFEHHEYSKTGTIGNPMPATKVKGEKCYHEIYPNHLAEFCKELKKLDIEVHTREWPERSY